MFPSITAGYAAVFALLLVALSAWVVAGRVGTNVMYGDGQQSDLGFRIRAQANFTEYVPFGLLLIALLEASGSSALLIHSLAGLLLLARVLHPIGIGAPTGSPRQAVCRGGGTIITLLVLAVAAIRLLLRVA